MTVSEWIKAKGKIYKWSELTIAYEDGTIILDDRIAYLSDRSKDYNAAWKKKCRGKKIIDIRRTAKGIILKIA